VVQIAGRQIRIAPSGSVIGLDLGAALGMAAALGYNTAAAAELLPAAEAGIVAAVDEAASHGE